MRQNTLLLQQAVNGDRKAEEQLLSDNMGLVHSLVRRFTGTAYEPEDLTQLGVIGLLKAIRNFDLSYGVQFSTYAVPMILGEIKRFIRDDGPVKVSRSIKETAILARKYSEELRQALGREPTIGEISAKSGIASEQLLEALDASSPLESIDKNTCDDNGIPLAERLAAPSEENRILDRVMIDSLLEHLTPRERKIMLLRYFHDKTQTEVAGIIGVSQVQISRIEKAALLKLRNEFS